MLQARVARRGPVLAAAAALAVLAALAFASSANAATHNNWNYVHGIVWADDCFCGDYRSVVDDIARDWGELWAYGYHYASDGTWQYRCGNYSRAAIYMNCRFASGNINCTKYAWTAGDALGDRVMYWHGHNAASC